MARSSSERIIKPRNNNNKRKRLTIHTSTDDLIKQKTIEYRRKDKIFKRRILLFMLFAIAAMIFSLFSTRNKLSSLEKEYNDLNSQYSSFQLTRDRIQTDLDEAIDIKEIQRYAMEELDMVYAGDSNTVYVDVNR
jgi:hypothetical protein